MSSGRGKRRQDTSPRPGAERRPAHGPPGEGPWTAAAYGVTATLMTPSSWFENRL